MNPAIISTANFFDELRKKEYAILDKHQHVYLDYTGGHIYPQSLVYVHGEYLTNAVYGNPHSSNPASLLSEKFVQEARETVCRFFNAGDYHCIFTSNASAALQIIGECYPFDSNAHLLLTQDNHNSVNGIREYCRQKGGRYTYSPMNENDLFINEAMLNYHLQSHYHKKNKLFAFPAQSNVSGVQHSLDWIQKAQELGWDVLLDAAAFVPTSKLDLTIVQPDFVAISFYKIFGYPTGIGCLLVKKSKFQKLKKPSFAGGTITLSSVRYDGYFLKQDHEKFENGTTNYLSIPAVTNGLAFISAISMEEISRRVKELAGAMLSAIATLRHDNGNPLIKLYGPKNTENRGGTFLLNFFDKDGVLYPFQYIEQRANAANISLRTGCFCNPGIDELNHGLSAEQLASYFTGRMQGDYYSLIQFLGKMRGAVRVSIGFPTNLSDIEKFISFTKQFINQSVQTPEPAAGIAATPIAW